MGRDVVSSDAFRVPVRGFTQGVRVRGTADLLFVSGMTARTANGEIAAVGNVAGQTRQVLENLRRYLADAGASLDDVVRIGVFLRDMDRWDEFHEVRTEYFGDEPPASTVVEVRRLYDERQLVEIEAVVALPPTPR